MDETNSRTDRIIGHTRALREDACGLASEVSSAAREIRAKIDLSRAVRKHPFRSVFIATGVGYVLGGGLFTPLTHGLLRIGVRAMLVPLLKEQLAVVAMDH